MRNVFEYYKEDDYLAHHGIKGQKWGIRRFQNPDGTLTAEGRTRYLSSNGQLTKEGKKVYNKANKTIDRTLKRIKYGQEWLQALMNNYWYETDWERERDDTLFSEVYTDVMTNLNKLHQTETLISDLGQSPSRDISDQTKAYGELYNDPRNPYRKV